MKALDAPPIWLALFLFLAWAQARLLPTPFPQPLGRDIGALAMLCGVLILAAARIQFSRHATTILPRRTPTALLTTGVFARSRNPIYLSLVLVLAGFALWRGSVLGLLLVPVLALVLTRRFIQPEEARLAALFGAAYQDYAARTRRWL